MTSIKKVDERYKENLAALNPQLNSAVSASDAAYKRQSDAISSIYEGQITESGAKYDDLARSNDIQKLINEREVAENMANLGLTDSGLNRTQQTAVILSHSNERSRIAREKQSMVDYLKRELTAKLSDIETSRASAEASIRSGYEKQAMDAAVSSYNTDVDAWQKNYEAGLKAAQEAAKKASYVIQTNGGLLNRNYTGTLEENNVDWYETDDGMSIVYVDNNSGKKTTLKKGVNPYTGTKNKDVLDSEGNYDKSKVFSNGYQPNNVDGNKLSKVNGAEIRVNGNKQSVWKTKGGMYYYWDGAKNKYEMLTQGELVSVGIIKRGDLRE